jgi:Fe-Mn family superoxide dismutase
MAFSLPDLSYDPGALEPHIDARTMEIHHDKHHNAYVTNLNAAIEGQSDLGSFEIGDLCRRITEVPEAIRPAVRNNGGGHFNHSLFWSVMGPGGGGEPSGELGSAIGNELGGFSQFQKDFAKAGATRFGSGWAWLCLDDARKLFVTSTPNQDNPLMQGICERPGIPILGLDVWEHAYYLNYQNRRPDYIAAWWNTVNWDAVANRYQQAKSG